MNPKSGGRAVLELEAENAERVVYRAELYTPEAVYRGTATIAVADGAVSWSVFAPSEPPAWLQKYAQTFLRSAWRERSRDAAVPWPNRLNRWREERE